MDYIIVGAGPSGLTLAYLLGKSGKKCLVLDQNDSIGGCHRVKRVQGLFTEHSPRVYVSSYVNTMQWFKQMGFVFDDIYTPYKFSVGYIMNQFMGKLYLGETLLLAQEFFKFMFQVQYDQTVTVQSFTESHGFSIASMDYLDRVCRFSDGAGSDRYSMYQFLQLINQQYFHKFYQPKLPNDIGLFPRIQNALLSTGNVTFQLNQTIQSIGYDAVHGNVTGVTTSTQFFSGANVILAVPPPAMSAILAASNGPIPTAFGNLSHWTPKATYNNDIAATFHWDTSLNLPLVWGFPTSEWGLISIPLTEYMNMNDDRSKTVISTCITYLDTSSSVLHLTANQITDRNILVQEMFRQLKESYPLLPAPTTSLLSPTVFRNTQGWTEQDSGFFKSAQISFLSSKSRISNLYQVGPQNGTSGVAFTTFEAAVTNAMVFYNTHVTSGTNHQSIRYPLEVRTVIYWVIIFLLAVLAGFLIWRYLSSKNRSTLVEHALGMN